MIDKNKLNNLIIEVKENLTKQIQTVSKTADILDQITNEIYGRDDLDPSTIWYLVSCNFNYRNDLRNLERQFEDDELELWNKILDLTHHQN